MKNLIFTLILTVTFLTACKPKDDVPPAPAKSESGQEPVKPAASEAAPASTSEVATATEPSKETVSSPDVEVLRLKKFDVKMDVLDPTPRGASRRESGVLTFIICAPKVNLSSDADAIEAIKGNAYPMTLSQGSQLVLRRDTTYRFGDGSNASKLKPVVLVLCD